MAAGRRTRMAIGITILAWLAAGAAAWAGPLTGVSAIGAGENHTLVVMDDGTVWACGQNGEGRIGDGTSGTNRYTLVQSVGLSGVANIAGGANHTIALKSDGTVRTWGDNSYGQLGDNSTTSTNRPKQMQIPENNPPIAYDFRAYCIPSGSVTSAPVYYDIDAGGYWTAVAVSNAAHGSVAGGENLVYTPDPGFLGEDSL